MLDSPFTSATSAAETDAGSHDAKRLRSVWKVQPYVALKGYQSYTALSMLICSLPLPLLCAPLPHSDHLRVLHCAIDCLQLRNA